MTTRTHCWCGGLAAGDVCLDSDYHDAQSTGRRAQITKLYVAGPMSGHVANNYPAFNQAAAFLRSAGYEVVNPAEFSVPSGSRVHYVDLLREDLRYMLDCHGVATIEGWWESTGARNETQVAGLLRMPVRTAAEWLERAKRELA
jgi:hypothetical protein